MEPGTRIITTRACPMGFFRKGQTGTLEYGAGDGSFLVRFDNEARARWVYVDEMRELTGTRRLSLFARLALSWLNLRREKLLALLMLALTFATLYRVVEIYAPNPHVPFLPAVSAVRG